MLKRILKYAVLMAACLTAVTAVGSSAAAGSDACPTGKDGHTLVRVGTECVDSAPLTPAERSALAAKEAYAGTYAKYRAGDASQTQLDAARERLQQATGITVPEPVRNRIAGGTPSGGASPNVVLGNFSPFRQVNSYYCGPASTESVLYYLASYVNSAYYTSATYDTVTGAYDSISGTASTDQALLANYFWLATDTYNGTPWGSAYVPFTLDNWLNTSFYVQTASGSLSLGGYENAIVSDVDSGFPAMENIYYDSRSGWPQGFNTSIAYQHWDTLYGEYSFGGSDYVQQGQVYASPGYTYVPAQTWSASSLFTAVVDGFGIVW